MFPLGVDQTVIGDWLALIVPKTLFVFDSWRSISPSSQHSPPITEGGRARNTHQTFYKRCVEFIKGTDYRVVWSRKGVRGHNPLRWVYTSLYYLVDEKYRAELVARAFVYTADSRDTVGKSLRAAAEHSQACYLLENH